jgi:hypothetical protein
VRGKLVKNLKIEMVLGSAGEELFVSVRLSKLEGETLVITATRATSLEGPVPFEGAAASYSSASSSSAEPVGRREANALRTA